MGETEVQSRIVKGLAVLVCLDTAVAWSSPPKTGTLEEQAAAEFSQVGIAVRERLDREAAGDALAARIAAQSAEAHRYRYLDLKREMERRSPTPIVPSVAAARNPFLPDSSFAATAAPTPEFLPARASDSLVWDLYHRPHDAEPVADGQRTALTQPSRSAAIHVWVVKGDVMYLGVGQQPRLAGEVGERRKTPAPDTVEPAVRGGHPINPAVTREEPRSSNRHARTVNSF